MKNIFWNSHPYLFTLISLLYVYLAGSWGFPPTQIIRPLLILWAILLLLSPVANKLGGGEHWGSILLTIFVLGLYFQWLLFTLSLMIVAIIIAIFIISLRLTKQEINIFKISKLLTIGCLVVLGAQARALVLDLRTIPLSHYKLMAERVMDTPSIELSTSTTGGKPDIYFIILDGYPRADVLMELFHYDNSDFIDYLEKAGFAVAKNAHSNYPRTALSVSSTLDMQYWSDISPKIHGINYWWLSEPIIDHSRVRASLESIGYQSISIASNWGITTNETTDLFFSPFHIILSDFENFLVLVTPIKELFAHFQNIAPTTSNETHRRYILFNFETLEKMPSINGPKFIVSHIIAPHPPFVFNADGSSVEASENFTLETAGKFSIEERRIGIINEIEFLNKKIQTMIQQILNDSKTPPIIILQADHGSDLYLDINSPNNSCIKERFSIFGAYYLPGKNKDIIPQDITPVNIFRIILNSYFGGNMAVLENRMYFTDKNTMFDLVEVTDQVDAACIISGE